MMPPDVAEFGPHPALRTTLEEIEAFVASLGDRAPRPRKVEVGAWTMSALRAVGQRIADAAPRSVLVDPFASPAERAMLAVLRAPTPVRIDPHLAHGAIRVYWIDDAIDRLAPTLPG